MTWRAGADAVNGQLPGSCRYCHAPHNGVGGSTPLWNQKLSKQVYTLYTSSTYKETDAQPAATSPSLLCLSCHDGTVAPGQTQAYGTIPTSGQMKAADVFGRNLQQSHPIDLALPIKDSPDLAASLTSSGKTLDKTGAVKLIKGNIECTTCHDPHAQGTDKVSQNFLVIDSSRGQLCLACHDPKRVVTGQDNRLSMWETSAHAVAANSVRNVMSAPVGDYSTVGQNACISCHQVHNAPGSAELLRAPNEQDCLLCHGGGSNISPAIPNVAAEFAKTGHPFPSANDQHQAGENALLNQNRHATCVDCHNAHSSSQVTAFPAAARDSRFANQCGGHQRHRRRQPVLNRGGQSIRELPALPRHQHRQDRQPRIRISSGVDGFGRRSAQCGPAVRADRIVQPSGDARAQQRIAAAQLAALHAESGRRDAGPRDGRTHSYAPTATTATTIASSAVRVPTVRTVRNSRTFWSAVMR